MPNDPSVNAYFSSISAELTSKADRIRHLIGDSHFLSDGHHKEYLLQGILERFLPNGFVCSRGFVVRDTKLQMRSKEQDLLIVDVRTHAPLFRESGVIVTFPENVHAAISVKTTLDRGTATDAFNGLASIPDIDSVHHLWKGIFGFRLDAKWDANPATFLKWLSKRPRRNATAGRIESWPCGAIACNGKFFLTTNRPESDSQIRAYRTDISAALFVAELTDHLATCCKTHSNGINDLLAGMKFSRIDPKS